MMDLYRMLETQDPSLPMFLSELSEFEYAKLSSQGDCTLSAKGLTKNNPEVENCSNCEHWKKIKMGSESQSYGECALGETNTLSHPNITFEDFHCSKQNYKRRIL